MNNKVFITVILIIYSQHFCQAQKNFSEGYIISLNDDTIYGKIKDAKSAFLANAKPIKITFLDKEGKEESYLASNIKGYSKSGIANFISIRDMDEGPFFARILIQGPVTLLGSLIVSTNNYGRSEGTRYFLLHQSKKSTYEVNRLQFKKEMAEYFSDYPDLQQLIVNKELRHTDLEMIVKKYNEWYLKK